MHCRADIEVSDIRERMPVILLIPGKVWLPSRPDRYREPWGGLEFFLDIEEMLPLYGVAAGLPEGHAELVEIAQQEVGHCVAGLRAAERDAAPVRELTVESKIHFIHLVAPLERVAAVDPR